MSRFNGLVKSVAKELKSYYDVTRREENFDLSSSNVPAYNMELLRFNRLFSYSNATDKSMRHYFQRPGLLKALQLEAESNVPKEKYIKQKLMSRLSKSASFQATSQTTRSKSLVTSAADSHKPLFKPQPDFIPLGLLALRSCQTPYLTRGEKVRVVESTTKLIAVTDSLLSTIGTKKRTIIERSATKSPVKRQQIDKSQAVTTRLIRPKTGKIRKPLAQMQANEMNKIFLQKLFILTKTSSRQVTELKMPIYIQLFGNKGKSDFILLKSNENSFKRGKKDKFDVEMSCDVGNLNAIVIGTKELSQQDFNWYLRKVQIIDETNKILYEFDCNRKIDNKNNLRALTLTNKRNQVDKVPSRSCNSSEQTAIKEISASHTSEQVVLINSPRIELQEANNEISNVHQQKSIFSQSPSLTQTPPPPPEIPQNNPTHKNYPTETFISPSIESELSTYKYTPFIQQIDKNLNTNESENDYTMLISPSKIQSNKKISLIEAVSLNSLSLVKEILTKSPELSLSTDENGQTLLLIACMKGYTEMVKYLIEENQLLLNIETPLGYSPVHYCAKYSHLSCLKVLYEQGALLNQQTSSGFTPLHLTAVNGNAEIARYLIEHGAQLNIKDDLSRTPLDLATNYGYTELIEYFKMCMNDDVNEDNKNKTHTRQSMIDSLSDTSSDY